jgi:tRNA(fMet)-specific endonuclease VapC
LLDTDHLTLIQRGEPKVSAHYLATPREERVASVISLQEQMRGRLAVINKLSDPAQLSQAYRLLREIQSFYCGLRVLDFDTVASANFESLRKTYRRLGTMDLRIAAIAITQDVILVTRNTQDFVDIENLQRFCFACSGVLP